MKVFCETVGPFAENSYFVADMDSKEAIAIDPGDEAPRLLEIIERHQLNVRYILNTHAHIDHVGAVEAIKKATGAPFYLHETEMPLLESLPMQAAMFGLTAPVVPEVDKFLVEGDVFTLGEGRIRVEVFDTPGHSPGSVTFRIADTLIVGDTLFAGSIGRTDLPGGDYQVLMRSIREGLLVHPDDTVVCPGHGASTTIGEERGSNPVLVGDG